MTIRAGIRHLSGLLAFLTVGCVYNTTTGLKPMEVTQARPAGDALPKPRHENVTRAAAAIDPPGAETLARLPEMPDLLPAEMQVSMTPTPEPLPLTPPPLPVAPEKLPPLAAALRAVLNKHPEQAAKELEGIDTPRRDRLLALLRLAADLEEQTLDRLSPQEVEATLDHLTDLSRQLRPKAPLKIQTICLCQSIHGYGQYERVRSDHAFCLGEPGRSGDRVQVYAEVCHFASKPVGEGRFETNLATALEVCDATGKVVSTMDLGTCADHSFSPRSDYFLNFQFHVPGNLEPGQYTLRVVVKDITSGASREAQATVPLRLRAGK
jgi:hypothetical protein